MSAEHRAAYADHKKCTEQLLNQWMEKDQKEAYKAAMEDMEDQPKAQLAVQDSMQHAASDAKAFPFEQQEADNREELR